MVSLLFYNFLYLKWMAIGQLSITPDSANTTANPDGTKVTGGGSYGWKDSAPPVCYGRRDHVPYHNPTSDKWLKTIGDGWTNKITTNTHLKPQLSGRENSHCLGSLFKYTLKFCNTYVSSWIMSKVQGKLISSTSSESLTSHS